MDFKSILKHRWPELLILAGAALLRLWLLGMKPPHFDEGVNGWFVDQMVKTGYYHYDPTNYHGPFHFYVLFLAQTLLGRYVWALRLPMVLVSLGTIWLAMKFERFLGRPAALWAAAAMAVSPGCVFYARYAIHEYWLVFALMLFAWGALGMWRSAEAKYLWAMWIGLTLAVLTKETYILHLACFLLTLPCVWALGKFSPAEEEETSGAALPWTLCEMGMGILFLASCATLLYLSVFRAAWNHVHGAALLNSAYALPFACSFVLMAIVWFWMAGSFAAPETAYSGASGMHWTRGQMNLGTWLFIGCVIFFYSGCLMDMPGLAGLFQAFAAWAKTGQSGNGHEKAWYYWLQLFARYEWPALLGIGFAIWSLWPRMPRMVRGIAIYGMGTLAAYSIIRYKTPWCIVSLTWPFQLLFGWGVARLTQRFRLVAPIAAGVVLAGSLAYAVSLNFYRYVDAKEPYVYVQTMNDVYLLTDPLEKLVELNPVNYQVVGNVVMDSYHPLPWLLGDFPNVGYYSDGSSPDQMDADFLVVEDERVDDVESKLKESYFTWDFQLRDALTPGRLYLNARKFGPVFPSRKPDFTPDSKPDATP